MLDFWDFGCSECLMLRMWDVGDVGYSRCAMFGMWDVWDIRCGIWDGTGMGDVDLQNGYNIISHQRYFT